MYAKDRKTAFSVQGFRVRRLNPDGTLPGVENHIGFHGTVDLNALEATSELEYRLNGKGDFTAREIDLTGVGSDGIATVDEVVTALNADTESETNDGFGDIFTASEDANGRLKVVLDDATDVKYLELKGIIATTLGFGASGDAAAVGTAFVNCFDNSGAINLPKNLKDYDEVEMESGDGTTSKMIVDALLMGLNPNIAMTDELYELKVMLQGGTWDETTSTYTPPTSEQLHAPKCMLEAFFPKYTKGTRHRGDMTGYKQITIYNLVGHETDVSSGVKEWASYEYECRAVEWDDENGVRRSAWDEKELTVEEFEDLGLTA